MPIDPNHPLVHFAPELGVAIRTPVVTLASPTIDELARLAERAGEGIHAPDAMPFSTAWTRGSADEVASRVVRHWLRTVGANEAMPITTLPFVVFHPTEGPIGVQDLVLARGWPSLATVSTGSWLTAAAQGRGIGTWMRRAVLTLAFRHLGAARAETTAHADNRASRRVSEKVGYREVGTSIGLVEGREHLLVHYRLERGDFEDDPSIVVTGLGPEVLERLMPRPAT